MGSNLKAEMKGVNSVTWTVPLRISISIGDLASHESQLLARESDIRLQLPESTDFQLEATSSDEARIVELAYSKFDKATLGRSGFDWQVALACAVCSHLAYENRVNIASVCQTRFSMDTCHFVESGSTQCFVTSSKDTVLVAFRGTEDTKDWMTNINVLTQATRNGSVHRGFYNAFAGVRTQLESIIEPLSKTRQIILTGHSLGGALATIAAAEWHNKYSVRNIYTYGQPRVGLKSFSASFPLSDQFFRFVNNNDIVPRVPPGFYHVGTLTHFDKVGKISGRLEGVDGERSLSLREFEDLKDSLKTSSNSAEAIEGLFASPFADHKLVGYLQHISKFAS